MILDAIHALRSPLTACRWQLELLANEPEERRESIALVTKELERMGRMLDDLGALAEAAEADFLRLEQIDLELFAHELIAEASAIAERDWRLDRAEGSMVGDAHRLGEAVMKLARNAVQHTDGEDVVAIGACLGDGEARLWVRDTGRGISVADQAWILDRLVHGTEAARSYRGRGLELAVAGAIARAHGGHIELASLLGEGSTFTIVVPAGGESSLATRSSGAVEREAR